MNSAVKGFKLCPLFYIVRIMYGRVFYFIMVIITGIFYVHGYSFWTTGLSNEKYFWF